MFAKRRNPQWKKFRGYFIGSIVGMILSLVVKGVLSQTVSIFNSK
jgi:uncharacterized membrane protein YfcA